jgi:hypothetical protein
MMNGQYEEFRFKLYADQDRRLLERIAEQSDGANKNNALRFLARHWFENERQGSLPQLGQESEESTLNLPQLGQTETDQDLEDAAKASISAAW